MFTSMDKALAAAIMGILFIVQTFTGFNLSWISADTINTLIGLSSRNVLRFGLILWPGC